MTDVTGETPPGVGEVMRGPCVSSHLKLTLDAWLFRDRVDAAADAELLAAVLGRRADATLRRSP